MVVLDTSIIVDHLRTSKAKNSTLIKIVRDFSDELLAISVISIQELYEGQSTKDKKKEKYLKETIKPLIILPYTEAIARLAGTIARDLKKPIELADAAIAATTIINKAKLATLNKRHFQKISSLEIFNLSF